jgi:hypothetical protein
MSRDHVVSVRFTAAELDRLRQLSGDHQISRYIRDVAIGAAEELRLTCELCPKPITNRDYRVRWIQELEWTSYTVRRELYAHEACFQRRRAEVAA